MTASEITMAYESWLRTQIRVDEADLAHKHDEMRADRFRFLRGTYYLWLTRITEVAPEALDGARVPLIGDLHVDNFGTWTDRTGVRRWGVNDLDELAHGPWLMDLLRLAVSAVVAPHVGLEEKDVCRVVLKAYASADPGPATDLDAGTGRAAKLRRMLPEAADPDAYWAALADEPDAEVPDAVAAAARDTAPPGWAPTWHHRVAGIGSLGHQRGAGVGRAADGETYAREVKELGPPTALWAGRLDQRLPAADGTLFERALAAVSGPAQALRVDGWQSRALAPDIVRLDLAALEEKDVRRSLRAMARAAADVHGADREAAAAARAEAERLRTKDFRALVRALTEAVRADHRAFSGSSLPSVGGGR